MRIGYVQFINKDYQPMKNIDYVNKKQAKEKGLPVDTVEKINSFYWDTIKKKLRALESQGVYIKELGTLGVSPYKINEYIKNLRKYIKNIRGSFKYGPDKKEQIIRDYKKVYKKCIDMRKIVMEDLEFKKTYDKHENLEPVS